jgi:hypothetical protein
MKKKIRMKMRTFATLSLSLSLSLCFSTRDGNRTRTDITVRRILSPVRLPVPPPGQTHIHR